MCGSIASINNSEQMGHSTVLVNGTPWLHLWDDPPLISRRQLAADSLFQPQQTSNNSAGEFRGLQVYQASVRKGPRLTLVITLPTSLLRVAVSIFKNGDSMNKLLPVQVSILESFTVRTSGTRSIKWSTTGHGTKIQVQDYSTSTHYSQRGNDSLSVGSA